MNALTPTQQHALAGRLDAAENPDWYLELLGTALEATHADFDRSLSIADEAVRTDPHPPNAPEDDLLLTAMDALALSEHPELALDPAGDEAVTV